MPASSSRRTPSRAPTRWPFLAHPSAALPLWYSSLPAAAWKANRGIVAYAPYRWIRSRRSYHSLTSIDLRRRGMVSASIWSETGRASRAGSVAVTSTGRIAGALSGATRTVSAGPVRTTRRASAVICMSRRVGVVLARAELVRLHGYGVLPSPVQGGRRRDACCALTGSERPVRSTDERRASTGRRRHPHRYSHPWRTVGHMTARSTPPRAA